MRPKLYFTLACCMLAIASTKAQSVGPSTLNASGGSKIIGNNTYEYSIGEMSVIATYSSSSLVVTQGILQPKLSPGGIAQHHLSATDLSVYPNPVQSTLFVQPSFAKSGSLQYVLTDASGKTVAIHSANLDLGNERQEISMAPYAAGQYTLSIIWTAGGNTATGAYKIQKIQ